MKENTINVVELTEVEATTNENESPILNNKNLELIESLPIELTVDLGCFSTSVKELYELKEGAVIALETKVNDPVKVYFDKQVVAEGVIVAADGYYGIEITNIAGKTS